MSLDPQFSLELPIDRGLSQPDRPTTCSQFKLMISVSLPNLLRSRLDRRCSRQPIPQDGRPYLQRAYERLIRPPAQLGTVISVVNRQESGEQNGIDCE
jgi:hypothetical protein